MDDKSKDLDWLNRDFRLAKAPPYLVKKVVEKMEKMGIRKRPDLLNQLLTKWIKEE